MSKARIKLTAPALRSRAEMEAMVGKIRELTIERNQKVLAREEAKKSIDDEHGPAIEKLNRELEEKTELCRCWAEANPSEFGERKSLDITHGLLGWRTGQPTLKTLSGWTWDRVLDNLQKDPVLKFYIREKPEVNRQQILADRETLGPDGLRNLGVKVVQEESFFVEPRLEELENRQVA